MARLLIFAYLLALAVVLAVATGVVLIVVAAGVVLAVAAGVVLVVVAAGVILIVVSGRILAAVAAVSVVIHIAVVVSHVSLPPGGMVLICYRNSMTVFFCNILFSFAFSYGIHYNRL